MMKNKIYLIIVFITLSISVSYSQIMSFTPEPEKFLKEVQSYLGNVNKIDAKKFIKEFEPLWLGNAFTPEQMAEIYSFSNNMAQKRLRPYPDYRNYMGAILNFVKSGKSSEDFNHWHITMDKVIEGRDKKRIAKYIETCSNLFSDNTVFLSSSTRWKASNNNYDFSFNKVPIITFKNTNLRCYSKNDSSVIYNTKGTYYPLTSMWLGDGGKITWERAGLEKDKVFAEINDYNISLKSAGFSADSVKFTSRYFDKAILGKITEKVLSNRGASKVRYPSFESYSKRLVIKNVFKDIDYDGGFSIRGANLQGSGTMDNLAKIIFKLNDEQFIVANAINFTINDHEITSDRAKIIIHIDEDSITHPGVNFNYVNKTSKLTLIRGASGISASPFYNSYHKIDMFFEALYWKTGDPIMEFAPLFGSTDINARFDSHNYFDPLVYDQLTGMGANPLVKIKYFAKQSGSNIIKTIDLATFMNKTVADIQLLLYQLTTLGFIDYNTDSKSITVKEKLYNYIDARKGERDFDVLVINSTAKQNATLNLHSYEMTIRGVNKVSLSDAQFVRIYPDSSEIILKKNRDIIFSGIINSGRTEYFGRDFTFHYDDFKLTLGHCDSMRLRALSREKSGPKQIRSLSILEDLKGEIFIDGNSNKSGLDTNFQEYPILNCSKETYVYYDDPSIQDGAYSRDSFKFIVAPFIMDSLDNFTNEGISLGGEFLSAGIFPKFNDSLRLQKDYSLGFIRNTPEDGFHIYDKAANYDNEIRLSHKGLQGKGSIDFFTSHAESDDITFFPDSVIAMAHTYENIAQEQDPEIPKVKGKDCHITYIPEDNVLYASSIKDDLVFFENEEATLNGRLELRPEGMKGSGIMTFGKGELLSYGYTFEIDAINADTSEFKLNSFENNLKDMAFKTQNVNAHVDFGKRKGEFKSNDGESFVEFPENQYICYMDQFNWNMDNDNVEMEASQKGDINIDTDLNLATSNFFSIHPDQDSLNFRSPKAKFDIKGKKLTCDKIDYITIADAQIYPDSSRIIIRKKAKIEPLQNAKILANYITKYHTIYDAEVNIKARMNYKASGTLDYVDENEEIQHIYYSDIYPDQTYQTTAIGEIDEKVEFKLNPKFEFHGKVELFASVKDLTFDGEAKILHECKNITANWVRFKKTINSKEVYIPIDSVVKASNGDVLLSGMVLNTTDSLSLYSTFLSPLGNKSHISLISSNGFIHYNKKDNEYQLSNMEKLSERKMNGTYTSLNLNTCNLEADGLFIFGAELGQVELETVGEIKFKPKRWSTDIKSSIIINFPFNDVVLEKMAADIIDYPDLRALDLNNSTYEQSLRELVGFKQSDKMISDLNIHGKIKRFPEELEKSMYLGDIRFKWNANKKAYVSYGDIGIANIKSKQVMRYVKGKIILYKKVTGDEITIHLEMDDNNYYNFNYKRGLMKVISTSEEFNTLILETKKDKTKFKVKDMDDFQFMLGTEASVTGFRRSFMQK